MAVLCHKIAIAPTAAQEDYFLRACGTARLCWNWALAEWNRQYESGEKPTAFRLQKQWNVVKYELFPWLKDVHRDAHARPFTNLGKAFAQFFDPKIKAQRPRFKKKGKCRDSFYVANDKLTLDGKRIKLPLIGWVKMRESLRFTGKVMSATVSRTANRWFVAITVEIDDAVARRNRTSDATVGVDVGVTHAAILSTGEKIEAPKPLGRTLHRLRMASRSLSRKQEGSGKWRKQKERLAKLHAKVANIRNDFWHKFTTRLCRENQAVGIEDLNVAGMVRNRSLSRALADVSIGMMGPMLAYKAPLYGTRIVKADRWYPSSKTCSECGAINKELQLSDRAWRCDCGAEHDRDVNAAINLANLALRAVCPKVTPVSHDAMLEVARDGNRSNPLAAVAA